MIRYIVLFGPLHGNVFLCISLQCIQCIALPYIALWCIRYIALRCICQCITLDVFGTKLKANLRRQYFTIKMRYLLIVVRRQRRCKRTRVAARVPTARQRLWYLPTVHRRHLGRVSVTERMCCQSHGAHLTSVDILLEAVKIVER